MIVLGITGGVGSGKSRVLKELSEKYNAYVIEADKLAHKLMEKGEIIYNNILKTFGNDILDSEKNIDRAKLGNIVFNDKEKLEVLNKISHPYVKQAIIDDINEKRRENMIKLFVIEAALLISDGYKEICDEIWYIYVSKEERVKRLKLQRGYSEEKCNSMFNSQESDEYYKLYADFTINNEKSFDFSSKQLKDRLNMLFQNGIIS